MQAFTRIRMSFEIYIRNFLEMFVHQANNSNQFFMKQKSITFPGIKQQTFRSTYLIKVIDNIEILVSIAVKISQ